MEGETLPRFDSKSRMFGNVKYPREHRIPEYTQKAAFFHLEIVSRWRRFIYFCWIELVTTLLMLTFPHIPACFFTVKHIYLTLYIVRMRRISPIYSVPACSRARARVAAWPSSLRPDRFRPIVVPAPAPAPVCARPRACVRARVCVRGRARGRACFRCPRHFIRLYGSFSRRASARWACHKLF